MRDAGEGGSRLTCHALVISCINRALASGGVLFAESTRHCSHCSDSKLLDREKTSLCIVSVKHLH